MDEMRFYKETNFKDTEIGKIPKDWEVVRLGEVLLLLRNGLTIEQNKEGIGYPITRIETISEGRIDASRVGYVANLTPEEIESYRLLEGDILFSHINSLQHIGKTAIYEGAPEFLLHGMNLLLLRPNKSKIYPLYLLYLLRLMRSRKIFWALSKKAVNQASINQTELGRTPIPVPPLPEQKKIAEILSTVDKLIQRTDEIIAKTERLKKGLMQELLTKGIGHKEFKETEIGRIPKDWEVVRLGDIASIIMGQSPPSSTYNKEGRGLPFLQGKMEFGSTYPTFSVYTSKPIKIAEADDILISVRAPVGDVNLAPFKLCIGRGLAAIRCILNKACHLYYFYFLQKIKELLEALGKGSTFKAIIKEDLVNLKIPLPPLSEQEKIAEILSTLDEKIEIERKRREKLERIKKSLMDLLLTGKIRVRVD
jgi:type I restriction enzyme S subunit